MLDWDDLRYFLAVARSGTLSAAARVLRVTQPTVGRRMAAFEKRLGAKLFVQTPAGHVLSQTGTRLLEHAERMESDALAAERVASGRDSGLSGLVRITASEWLVDRTPLSRWKWIPIWPPATKRVSRAVPGTGDSTQRVTPTLAVVRATVFGH
ncbi:MAG TPA: LysR family transcriptional regulator [Candidatus Krumholzibacteria bacterium]